MKTLKLNAFLIALSLIAAIAACGGAKNASSPTEAFKNFYTAAKGKDVAGLKKVMSKDTLAEMEKEAKGKNQSLDDFLANESQKGLPANMPETQNEKIDGDKATIEFKREGSSNWSTASFIKEDGGWKVNFK